MTQQYRLTQLTNATLESHAARQRFDSAKTKTARRIAAEDLEFWSNKAAFLANFNIVSA